MNLSMAERIKPGNANAAIDAYILAHTAPEPQYLKEVARNTHLHMINPRMMSGNLQGRILKTFVAMMGARHIVEIGTFSGYAALCMAEAVADGGMVTTIEIDDEQEDFIREQLASAPHGEKVNLLIGDAADIIPTLDGGIDLAFIDADKRSYQRYFELLLPLMRRGGIILADNTLWDGKVLIDNPHPSDHQTIAIKSFNDSVVADARVECVMLPLRDGLTMIRKL